MRRLYTFFRSSTSYRLRIALNYKGLAWEPHYVSLPRMEHRAAGYMQLNLQVPPALVEVTARYLRRSPRAPRRP
jgi:glutathione S-transferase